MAFWPNLGGAITLNNVTCSMCECDNKWESRHSGANRVERGKEVCIEKLEYW